MEEKKGAVYFLKMNKVDAVKIGYSNQSDVFGRVTEIKTYCPYGAELIGFISSYDAFRLEKEIHERFKAFRLKGEWFDVSIEQCKKLIDFYTTVQESNERQEFEINYAKMLSNKLLLKNSVNKFQPDIHEFISIVDLEKDKRHSKKEFQKQFIKHMMDNKKTSINDDQLSSKAFTIISRDYFKSIGYDFVEGNTNGVRWFSIS